MSELGMDETLTDPIEVKLDMEALAELQDLLEEDFVSLLDEFISSSEQCSAELVEHIQNLNYDELRRGAHSLKGSALNVGAPELGACWSALEEAAVQTASKETLETLFEPAQLELGRTTTMLRKHFF